MMACKMFDAIKNFFKLHKKHKLHRCVYAVTQGAYLGEMLIFINESITSYQFLSIPDNINRIIPKEKFDFGLENNILQFVKRLPESVYRVIVEQYKKNELSN